MSRLLRFLPLLVIQGLVLGARAQLLDPPELRCATVNLTGDVSLTWIPTSDPGGIFDEYRVFASGAFTGPYVQVGTVTDLAQTTYFHAGAGAQGGPRYYYVTTVSTSPEPNVSISSDTLVTLFVEVGQSTPLGNAVVQWNMPTVLPSSQEITIWQEFPLGEWTLVGTVAPDQTSFSHPVSVCDDSLTFRVGLADALGCVSYSSRDGDEFSDATPPSMPVMTTLTVDTMSGLTELQWAPSPEGDTDGYIILLTTPNGNVILDTIYGQDNTTYQWSWSDPFSGPESFTVAAFDTCLVGDPPSPNTSATLPAHTTVHLTTGYDRCSSTIHLYWTPYEGWDVAAYRVYMQVDGGAWSSAADLPGNSTSYSRVGQPDRTYCFLVKAVHQNGTVTSLSNPTCRTADYPAIPQFNYLRRVTVTGPSQIMIVDSVDVLSEASSYTLERSANGTAWEPIATAGGWEGPVITFYDNDVDPTMNGYRYRVQVRDSCGMAATTSNVAGNIVLRATPDLHNRNLLQWNGYAEWAGTTLTHVIHRSVADGPYGIHSWWPGELWYFSDDVQDLIETNGRTCYFVQAVETGNPSGINATSESNIACAVQEDLVYIPNAFVVGGHNNEFIPVLGYVDVSQYEFSILNRWGQVIWTTHDRYEGWNGVVGSQVMPTGVYSYYCSFHDGEGKRIVRRGHVTLLTAEGN